MLTVIVVMMGVSLLCHLFRDQLKAAFDGLGDALRPAGDAVGSFTGTSSRSVMAFGHSLLDTLLSLLKLRATIGALLAVGSLVLMIADWELLKIGLELLIPPDTAGYTVYLGSIALYADPTRILAMALILSQIVCGIMALHRQDLTLSDTADTGEHASSRMQRWAPWMGLLFLAVCEALLAGLRVQAGGPMTFLLDPGALAQNSSLSTLPPLIVGAFSFGVPILAAVAFAYALTMFLCPIVKVVLGGIGFLVALLVLGVMLLFGSGPARSGGFAKSLIDLAAAPAACLIRAFRGIGIGIGIAGKAIGIGIARAVRWVCNLVRGSISGVYGWLFKPAVPRYHDRYELGRPSSDAEPVRMETRIVENDYERSNSNGTLSCITTGNLAVDRFGLPESGSQQ